MPTFEQVIAARRAELIRALAGGPADQPEQACTCGRAVRALNFASTRPACVGCGFLETACRCRPFTEGSTP